MMLKNVSGESKIGCLFYVLVVAAIVYSGFNWGKAKWNYESMKDEITKWSKIACQQKNIKIKEISDSIEKKAEELDIELYEDSIEIIKDKHTITINVDWTTDIKFPGYTYQQEHFVTRTEQNRY
jgi:carbonic anhydrase